MPYYFGRVLRLTTAIVRVSSTAQVASAPDKIGGSPTSGTDGMGNGDGTAGVDVYGGRVGRYLIPIGLDWNTPYTPGQQLMLHRGQIGPVNWDTVALGGTGGDNLRENIANG